MDHLKELITVKGLSEAKIEKIVTVARTMKVRMYLFYYIDNRYLLHRKGNDEHETSSDH